MNAAGWRGPVGMTNGSTVSRGRRRTYAPIAQAIRRFEPVRMVAEPHCAEDARDQCGADIEIIPFPIDDPWMRDSGPTFLTRRDGTQGRDRVALQRLGRQVPDYADNARLARRVLSLGGVPLYQSSLCLEGGAIHTDGEGTVITTESVVLNPNRNPGISKRAAERELCDALWGDVKSFGCRAIPTGSSSTSRMATSMGCCASCDLASCCMKAIRALAARRGSLRRTIDARSKTAVDAAGRRLQIISIDDAYEAETPHDMFCRSYVNFYIANGGIVMPAFGVPGDARALAVIQACVSGPRGGASRHHRPCQRRRRDSLHYSTAAGLNAMSDDSRMARRLDSIGPLCIGRPERLPADMRTRRRDPDADAEAAAIQSLANDWFKAIAAKDLEKTLSFYAPEAQYLSAGRPAAATPEERRKLWVRGLRYSRVFLR